MYETPIASIEVMMDPVTGSHDHRWESPIDPDFNP